MNVAINGGALDAVFTVPDELIYGAQEILVKDALEASWKAEVVEPAGAAAFAVARAPWFAERVEAIMQARGLERTAGAPLRVCVTISGGNPSPAQLEALRS